jgi:hypothetical protein
MAYRLILDETVDHEGFHLIDSSTTDTTSSTSISSPNSGRGL